MRSENHVLMLAGTGENMKIDTKYFGEIEIGDEKIIHFENGLLGFEDYNDFTILFDIDAGEQPLFSWLQSVTERNLAFPVVNPLRVKEDYNPIVEDGLLETIGGVTEENLFVLLLATVPKEIKETSVNLKAPLIINSDTRKGIQVIVENADYEVKYKIIGQS